MSKVRRLKIRGQQWRIIFGRPPKNKCAAYCDPNVRTIWIRPSDSDTQERKTACVLHEILHALFYDLREEVVEEAEEALLKGLELVSKRQ